VLLDFDTVSLNLSEKIKIAFHNLSCIPHKVAPPHHIQRHHSVKKKPSKLNLAQETLRPICPNMAFTA
jgi:hypothetical protein